jgi:hypothetical protein
VPSINLTDPVAGTIVASGLIATNNALLETLLNGTLDFSNIKGSPALVANEAIIWDGSQFIRSTSGSGTLNLGNAATAKINFHTDTSLFRVSANTLKASGDFDTGGNIHAGSQVYVGSATSVDTPIYRYAANYVGTIGSFISEGALSAWGFKTLATGDTTPRVFLRNDAMLQFGGGTTALDTNLYRVGAGTLRTDGGMWFSGPILNLSSYVAANYNMTTQVIIGDSGAGVAGIAFGSASDATINRASAGTLDFNTLTRLSFGRITARNGLADQVNIGDLFGDATHAAITFGSSQDVYVYRVSAGILRVEGSLQTSLSATVGNGGASGSQALYTQASGDTNARVGIMNSGIINFGPGNAGFDTTLFRNAANDLKTGGQMTIAGNVLGQSSFYAQNSGSITGFIYNPATMGGVAFYSAKQGDANARFYFGSDGDMHWGCWWRFRWWIRTFTGYRHRILKRILLSMQDFRL